MTIKSLSTILLRLYQWLVLQATFATEAKQSISVRCMQEKKSGTF